jgi:hypothetical protein
MNLEGNKLLKLAVRVIRMFEELKRVRYICIWSAKCVKNSYKCCIYIFPSDIYIYDTGLDICLIYIYIYIYISA